MSHHTTTQSPLFKDLYVSIVNTLVAKWPINNEGDIKHIASIALKVATISQDTHYTTTVNAQPENPFAGKFDDTLTKEILSNVTWQFNSYTPKPGVPAYNEWVSKVDSFASNDNAVREAKEEQQQQQLRGKSRLEEFKKRWAGMEPAVPEVKKVKKKFVGGVWGTAEGESNSSHYQI